MISLRSLSCLFLLLAMSLDAAAMFMPPREVPVDRLVANAEKYLEAHPHDADAVYTLARIHYLAFSLKTADIPALGPGNGEGKPHPAPQWMIAWGRPHQKKEKPQLSDAERANHASKALEYFEDSVKQAPKNGLYQLGLASLLEELWRWKSSAASPDIQGIALERVRDAYLHAFDLGMASESKLKTMPIEGAQGIVAYEAGSALIRLEKERPGTFSETQKAAVQQAIDSFKKLPMGGITPIVFSFQQVEELSQMLDASNIVDFDLRGFGMPEHWPWVKPELGFLVWDPAQTRSITSAQQMFGSYTFQIFWQTGYHALASLDDNADGLLNGAELEGIAVWFDSNGDARSQNDEVAAVDKLKIESISTRAESLDGVHPTNAAGIKLRDGTTLRTWDWTVEPVTATTPLRASPP